MLRLAPGLGIGDARPRAFTPAALFASGSAGAWYDAGDAATVFADVDGTVPATIGGPVARIDDKSGNGNHLLQPMDALQPIWRRDAAGACFLAFDGTDDWLRAAMPASQPIDRISALVQLNWHSANRVFHGSAGLDTGNGMLRQSGVSPALDIYSGAVGPSTATAAIANKAIVIERHFGAQSRIAINDNDYAYGDAGDGAIDSLTVGASGDGSRASSVALYALVQVHRLLNDPEIDQTRRFMSVSAAAL